MRHYILAACFVSLHTVTSLVNNTAVRKRIEVSRQNTFKLHNFLAFSPPSMRDEMRLLDISTYILFSVSRCKLVARILVLAGGSVKTSPIENYIIRSQRQHSYIL